MEIARSLVVGYIEEEDDLSDDSDDDMKGGNAETAATSISGDDSSGRSFERRVRRVSSGSDSERSGGGNDKRLSGGSDRPLSFSYKSSRVGGLGRLQSTHFGRLASFGGTSGSFEADAKRADVGTGGGSGSASADERRKSFGSSTNSGRADTRRNSFGGHAGAGTVAVGHAVKLSAEAAAIVNLPSPPTEPKNASASPGGTPSPVRGKSQGDERSSPKRSLSLMAERPVELEQPIVSVRGSDREDVSFSVFCPPCPCPPSIISANAVRAFAPCKTA